MRTWTNENASRYCSFILRRPVEAEFVQKRQPKFLAQAVGRDRMLFFSRELPRWIFWHEAGHLTDKPCKLHPSVMKEFLETADIGPPVAPLFHADIQHDIVESIISYHENVASEIKAHLWAIQDATDRHYEKVVEELTAAVGSFQGYGDVYSDAGRVLSSVLKLTGFSQA